MIGRSYLIPRGDRAALVGAAEALRDWDALWDLEVPPRDARLYDAEATLYGVCLRSMTVPYNHRAERAERGDLLVVPRELALDVEPEVDMLALRRAGDPPDHFRERFIQVWGFERLGPRDSEPAPRAAAVVISSNDVRYPLSYSLDRGGPATGVWNATEHATAVLIGLEGRRTVAVRDESRGLHALDAGDALLVGPGLEFACEGDGLLGLATLFTALGHEVRRAAAARIGMAPGPEFDPAARRAR